MTETSSHGVDEDAGHVESLVAESLCQWHPGGADGNGEGSKTVEQHRALFGKRVTRVETGDAKREDKGEFQCVGSALSYTFWLTDGHTSVQGDWAATVVSRASE